ncbi:MAG: GDSL-type esterase/lipase family protein [Akkermansiaceae bacterium]|jgi:lysophospholipase L1-like esterase|nr:GDSL-type esterase/lipase family protein [Akkermansiaceae bacterium]
MKRSLALISLFVSALLHAGEPSTERIGIEDDYARINAEAEKASTISLRPATEVSLRGGMPHLFEKLEKGEAVTIAYYGGSITAGPGWRNATLDWFAKQYPGSKVTELNASLGGSGSIVGVFRADHDLVSAKPDAVFIEFSLNDVADVRDRPAEVAGALEGIIRKLRISKPETDICLAYTLHSSAVDLLNQGKFSASVSLHESIAEHYGIPSIHLGVEAARMAKENKLVFSAPKSPGDKDAEGRVIFSNDGTHPSEAGHALNGAAAVRGLERLRSNNKASDQAMPKALSTIPWEKAKTIAAEGHAEFSGTWEQLTASTGPGCRRFGKRFYSWFPHLFRSGTPGSSVTVRFRGTHIGLKGMEGPDSGVVSIRVDDKPPFKQTLFTVYASAWVYVGAPLPAVPMGDHTVTWTLLDEVPEKEKMLSVKKADQDFRNNPGKYAKNTFSVGQIIVLGDLLDEKGNLLR